MQIHPNDNVEVRENGHKYALVPIKAGENVIKYGSPIGHATEDIGVGAHVHTHNLKTNLSGNLDCLHLKTFRKLEAYIFRILGVDLANYPVQVHVVH